VRKDNVLAHADFGDAMAVAPDDEAGGGSPPGSLRKFTHAHDRHFERKRPVVRTDSGACVWKVGSWV